MLKTTRRAGRPDAQTVELLNQHILSTATKLFIDQGYAATSMEQIASAAGAGKQTIYRRYASKEELFGAVMLELVRALLDNPLKVKANVSDPMLALRDLCWSLMNLAFEKPETMAMYRILVAEALRFPDMVTKVAKTVLQPIDDMITLLLEAARLKGQIRDDIETERLCHVVGGMCTGWIFQQKLLGNPCLITETERRAFFESVWTVLLKGVSV